MLENDSESSLPNNVESSELEALDALVTLVLAVDELWVPGCEVRATAANTASAAAEAIPIA